MLSMAERVKVYVEQKGSGKSAHISYVQLHHSQVLENPLSVCEPWIRAWIRALV
jgi:hypothetical protein